MSKKPKLREATKDAAPTSAQDRKSWIGSMKDTISILGDIISPATEEKEWEILADDAPEQDGTKD